MRQHRWWEPWLCKLIGHNKVTRNSLGQLIRPVCVRCGVQR